MRILVDADACPVKEQIIRVSKKMGISVIMFVDTSHEINDGYSTVITVDKGRDSVDIKLVNEAKTGDVVVTQDFGVASMALAKGSRAINQNGMAYDASNIDRLLFERHISAKARKAGGKSTKHKKRNKENNNQFETEFQKIINEIL